MAVAPWIVSDELWELVEPLLPMKERRFRYPGRKRLPDRQALQGILFVLHTGISWTHLPAELGFGSGVDLLAAAGRVAAGRRLGAAARGAARAAACGGGDRVVAGGRRLQPRAGEKGGSATGPSPVDRARNGSKHHLLVDATGIPLAWTLTGGNRNDVTQLIPLLDRVPAGARQGRPAAPAARAGHRRPRLRPRQATAACSASAGSRPEIARRKTEHGSGLGRYRWVVERTFAWLHQFKRLLVRYERRADIHEAFLAIGCCLICFRRLRNSSLSYGP